MEAALLQILVCIAAVLFGSFLRTIGIVTKQDAKAASKVLQWVTFPSFVLQTLLTYGIIGWEGLNTVLAALFVNIGIGAFAWAYHSRRRKPLRALLAGSAIGVELGSIMYGFVQAIFGPVGLHFAVLWDIGNLISVSIFQRMLYAQGSSKAPERYLHADGGVYRGEWKNGKKHGLGVYVYPNNARYEGRWVENVKQGLGTYYYPKGGWYEGEWRDGERSGLGLRTLSTGRTKAGLWQGQSLLESRVPSECAFVASKAREISSASKRVSVGQHGFGHALIDLFKQPIFLALLILSISTFSGRPIPLLADFMTGHLATAHIPLTLLTFGIGLDLKLPSSFEVKSVAQALAPRIFGPILFGVLASSLLSFRYLDLIAVTVFCALGPLSEQVAYYRQLFVLNASLGDQIQNGSKFTAIFTGLLFSIALIIGTSQRGTVQSFGIMTLTMAAFGSVITQFLLKQNSRPFISQQKNQSSVESVGPSVPVSSYESPVEQIPIGIAWEEMRRERELEEGKQNAPEISGKIGEDSQILAERDDLEQTTEIPGTLEGMKNEANETSTSNQDASSEGNPELPDGDETVKRRRKRQKRSAPGSLGFMDIDEESIQSSSTKDFEFRLHEPPSSINMDSDQRKRSKGNFIVEALPLQIRDLRKHPKQLNNLQNFRRHRLLTSFHARMRPKHHNNFCLKFQVA